jgi:DNA-binding NtrC family response regulator
LGGRNGTLVDGSYIQECELEPLHEVRFGDTLFKFVESGAERYLAFAADGTLAGDDEEGFSSRFRLLGGHQMHQLSDELGRIAGTSLYVLLLGEKGTGKEVAARELHRASGRKGAFCAVNCAAIPSHLLESELFGYRRGAFSGADKDKPGIVKAADGGTLFLDEIGDMPHEAQAKLLRVLQSREVFPLGATAPERADVRVVSATHRDLPKLVQADRFRADLYARLAEHVVRLPPLRERKEDVCYLAEHFLRLHGGGHLQLTFPFRVALLHYDWPFNVRELESCIKRAIALADADEVDTHHLPEPITEHMRQYGVRPGAPPPSSPPLGMAPDAAIRFLAEVARKAPPTDRELRELLQQHGGNVAAVGRVFGKERMQVHRWMKRYGIRADEYRTDGESGP